MILLLIGSITIPFVLGGIRLALNSPGVIFGDKAHSSKLWRVLYSLVAFVLTPFHSVILHLKMHRIQLKLNSHPQNRKLKKEKDELTFHQRNFTKVEVGLETIYQMVILNIILFATQSRTRTYDDLIFVLFKQKENSFLSTEVLQIIGFLSIGYSFISCVRTHLDVLSAEREYFPFVGKAIAGLCSMFAVTKRVMAMILFFAPALGLFDLLHHWSAEQTKWHPDIIEQFVDNAGNIQFGGSLPIPWNQIDRWVKNVSEAPGLKVGHFLRSAANPNYLF